MKKYYSFCLLLILKLLLVSATYAQYGNEWIVPGQSYYKIPIATDGIYAITYHDLQSAGIFGVDPRKFQLFHRGVEQAIWVKGENDGVFSDGDSIIFYGKGNDGTLDSMLYLTPDLQPHKYYNTYSDTTAYFLTWSSGNGKRMNLISGSANSPAPYHWEEKLYVYSDDYSKGQFYGEACMAEGDIGEGWCSSMIYTNGTNPAYFEQIVPINNLATTGPAAALEILLIGRNNNTSHTVQILLGNDINNPDTVYNVPVFSNQNLRKLNLSVPLKYLLSPNLKVNIKVVNREINGVKIADGVSAGYIKLKYPQLTNLEFSSSKKFHLANPSASSTLEIINSSSSSIVFDISNTNSISIVNASLTGSTLTTHLPANTTAILVANHLAFKPINSIFRADLSRYSHSDNANYIIITNKKLMASAIEYAAYRAGSGGGSYDTLVADVEKLFNVYTYGERTPLAIRRFCKDLIDHGVPEYLLIIGKGLLVNYSGNTDVGSVFYRKNPQAFINNTKDIPLEDLVPTAGIPGSDLLFSMGLGGKPRYVAALATGRIPAKNDSEVRAYLNKVKEHESLPSNLLWRKHALHLSGGGNVNELARFKGYMNYFKTIVEDTIFGGKVVRTLSKNLGAGPIDERLKYSVADEMNKGLSYITFFGHSSANVIDVDIGNVSNPLYGYNNKGKYPLLFVNGCASANVFAKTSFAEDWIVTADKGAILVIGHSDIGYENELYYYTNTFYKHTFKLRKNAGKSVGMVQKEVIKELDSLTGSHTAGIRATNLEQMTLQGDPAVIVYSPEKTDYAIGKESIFIKSLDGNPVTAVSDSFAVGVIVTNYGITAPDSIAVNLVRTFGDKEVSETVMYKPISYLDTLYIIVKSKDPATYGVNKFSIKVDYYDTIPEFNEMNNTADLEYFMPLSGVTCLYPKEFSVVSSQPVQFIAQSTDLFIEEKDYWIELDTSYFFNSPFKKTATIHSGSLIKWTSTLLPDIAANDSIVYYWRVRFKDIPLGEDTLWGTSSFIYIKNSPEGWSQSEFWQFKKDHKENILDADPSKTFDFSGVTTKVHIKTHGDSIPNFGYLNMEVSLNEGVVVVFPGFGFCGNNGFLAMTFDKNTVQPYLPIPTPDCGRADKRFLNTFSGLNHSYVRSDMHRYLQAVKEGDYVLLVSVGNALYSLWKNTSLGDSIRKHLSPQLLDSINDQEPYIILAKKGAGAPIVEMHSPYTSASLTLDHVLTGKFNNGYITSTLIGPSQHWGKFYRTVDMEANDVYNIQIQGIDLNGNTNIINIPQTDSLDLYNYVDASVYPYIKLRASLYDSSASLDPPQLKKWQVIYNGVPEGTMNPALAGLDQYKVSTRYEGDSITIRYVFENISLLDFPDTVKVKFSIRNESGINRDTLVTLGVLKKDGSFSFNYTFSTKGLAGNNTLQAFVNPRLQPEEYYNNNIIETSFRVEADKINPVLDVVFDGVHIMDGDIVSPSPLITISIKDENKFLFKNNTDGMEVFLKRPGRDEFEKIELSSNPDIISAGQVGGKINQYVIQYNPKNLPDGIYTLRVQGTDASGNKSGTEHYEIRFEVINKSTITHFYPYPNPFSTSTRFVFTLTGSEIPEDLKIQIMTVSGKVVREITKSELGPIRIGNNKTDFAWDGTDEFGDRLANGVYLYRVIIKNKGENFSHRDSSGDRAFKKEFGKLYILR